VDDLAINVDRCFVCWMPAQSGGRADDRFAETVTERPAAAVAG
jgi:hypothetical protein